MCYVEDFLLMSFLNSSLLKDIPISLNYLFLSTTHQDHSPILSIPQLTEQYQRALLLSSLRYAGYNSAAIPAEFLINA